MLNKFISHSSPEIGVSQREFINLRVIFALMIQINPDQWYSIPEIADFLGVRQRDVRTMIDDSRLIARRHGENNAWAINGAQLIEDNGEIVPLPSLRGTLTVLYDSGFSKEEAFEWLLCANDEIGQTPLTALRDGNVHAVRRVATGLAF